MQTIRVTKTTTRQSRYELDGRRRYVSWVLIGTTCETRAIRELVYGGPNAADVATLRAPSDWPVSKPLTFDEKLAIINAYNPNL
jgi:hypothetical protein